MRRNGHMKNVFGILNMVLSHLQLFQLMAEWDPSPLLFTEDWFHYLIKYINHTIKQFVGFAVLQAFYYSDQTFFIYAMCIRGTHSSSGKLQ